MSSNHEKVKKCNIDITFIPFIKGGFPPVKICDDEFLKKYEDRKPREFSNKNIISIKDMLASKKKEVLLDLLSEPNIILNKRNTGSKTKSKNNKKINIIDSDNISDNITFRMISK
jgi:hypothetical protein